MAMHIVLCLDVWKHWYTISQIAGMTQSDQIEILSWKKLTGYNWPISFLWAIIWWPALCLKEIKGHDLTCFHYLQFQSLFESSKTRSRQYPEPIGHLTVTCTSCLSPINSGQSVINKNRKTKWVQGALQYLNNDKYCCKQRYTCKIKSYLLLLTMPRLQQLISKVDKKKYLYLY